jgi:hypothetical protein
VNPTKIKTSSGRRPSFLSLSRKGKQGAAYFIWRGCWQRQHERFMGKRKAFFRSCPTAVRPRQRLPFARGDDGACSAPRQRAVAARCSKTTRLCAEIIPLGKQISPSILQKKSVWCNVVFCVGPSVIWGNAAAQRHNQRTEPGAETHRQPPMATNGHRAFEIPVHQLLRLQQITEPIR